MSEQHIHHKADQAIRCIACGKIIGQGYVMQGVIKLRCKCGVKTTIEATQEKKPEGRCDLPKITGIALVPSDQIGRSATM